MNPSTIEFNDIHFFSRYGVFTVENGKRIPGPQWYPAAYGQAANVFLDRNVKLWFCGQGEDAQLLEFTQEGEPTHVHLDGYTQQVKDFTNSALWGTLSEKVPNISDSQLVDGLEKFLEFSISTAERICNECTDRSTLIFQDYQFFLLPGILNGTITPDDVMQILSGRIDQSRREELAERLSYVQEEFAPKECNHSIFIHTSVPCPQYWDALNPQISKLLLSSITSVPVGVHAPNWQDRIIKAMEHYGIESPASNVFVSPIGMSGDQISEFLTTPVADIYREQIARDVGEDADIVLLFGRIDPKNGFPHVLKQISKSLAANQEMWANKTLVLQCPRDEKIGCTQEFENVSKWVDYLREQNLDVLWYQDNNRDRALVLAERSNTYVVGGLLGGFEVVTLEAIFANSNCDVICSDGIGSAYVLGDLATLYHSHEELPEIFKDIFTSQVQNKDRKDRSSDVRNLQLSLSPESWLKHLVSEAEGTTNEQVQSRVAFLDRSFQISGLVRQQSGISG